MKMILRPDLRAEGDERLDHDRGLRVDVRAADDLGALQRLVLGRPLPQRHHRRHLLHKQKKNIRSGDHDGRQFFRRIIVTVLGKKTD